MLKINLLPSYIYQRRKVRQTAALFGILVLGVGAGMFAWISRLNGQKNALNGEVTVLEQQMNDVKAIEAQAAAEEGKAPVTQSKVTFIEGLMAYNLTYPQLYEDLAQYTYGRIRYRSIEGSGTELKIGATARSVGDCGRYLLNMYRASHLFSTVTIDNVPGWSGNVTEGFDFTVTCTLVKPITAPTYGAAAGGASGPPTPQ